MKVKYRKGSTLGAADFMNRFREGPGGEMVVGGVQPGMAEGDESPGVTKASVKVFLEEETLAQERDYLCSKDFVRAQKGCKWVSAL